MEEVSSEDLLESVVLVVVKGLGSQSVLILKFLLKQIRKLR